MRFILILIAKINPLAENLRICTVEYIYILIQSYCVIRMRIAYVTYILFKITIVNAAHAARRDQSLRKRKRERIL